MSIQESAIAYHDNGFNCAQSVLAALQEETGPQVDDDEDKERQQCPAVGLAVQTLIHGFASSQFSLFAL